MPTCLYGRKSIDGERHWCKDRELSLAGRNTIWHFWKNNRTLDDGWEIQHDEIVSSATSDSADLTDYRILVNVLPHREGVVELLLLNEICVFTHSQQGSMEAEWSIYLLKMQQFFVRQNLTPQEKDELTQCFPDPQEPGPEVVTFLYMHGDDKGWRPGPVNATAGALIYPGAREYYKKHF